MEMGSYVGFDVDAALAASRNMYASEGRHSDRNRDQSADKSADPAADDHVVDEPLAELSQARQGRKLQTRGNRGRQHSQEDQEHPTRHSRPRNPDDRARPEGWPVVGERSRNQGECDPDCSQCSVHESLLIRSSS